MMKATADNSTEDFKNLVYLLGHDVRNSLRALIEVPAWIAEDLAANGEALPGDVGEYVALIGTHAKRVDKMVNDLLLFSQIGQSDDVRLLDLDQALDDVLASMRLPPGFAVSWDLKCHQLMMGAGDFKIVLTELLNNAAKHHKSTNGKITITSRLSDDTFEMIVADDGPGIAEAHRQQVFLPMKTMRPRDEIEGSGMGLSIARKIIEAYGGTLTIEDSAVGSAFKISIANQKPL